MRFLAFLLPALLLASCGGEGKNIPIARKAVAEFHQRLNNGDYDAIIASRAESLRRSNSEADLFAVLYSVTDGLGPMMSSKETGASEQVADDHVVVSLHYRTQHERGKARERFTFDIEKGVARLSGYQVERADPGSGAR